MMKSIQMKMACFLLLLLAACGDRSAKEQETDLSTADSTIIRYTPDTGPLTDTDDFNKPSSEDITLDSPLGSPSPGWDTVLRNPEGGTRKPR
ncbi:hypothetical protein EPD60_08040 [Flaviaesturariibacter flavus]|uniref:Secreted protein n=1 Tax=Flaviaesturariibacter flavus TaxID=2502780 RepID=A0A4R1BAG8_9BACT|nr:hypothetical protein [Flaviaesturariibacter flavus]TCJ13955.1 hypothetical protein EPD60_08040 [Flaviaesturariibacter flavus]